MFTLCRFLQRSAVIIKDKSRELKQLEETSKTEVKEKFGWMCVIETKGNNRIVENQISVHTRTCTNYVLGL